MANVKKVDPSDWANFSDEALREALTMSDVYIARINGPWDEAWCNTLRNSGDFKDSYTWEEVDLIVSTMVKYNPTLDVAKFRSYVVECSGATIEGSSSSPWLWLGALGLVGLGVYAIARKGK
ncbi:MAG: hypothetical protein WC565_03470 [Parcubacteria group bacterium]